MSKTGYSVVLIDDDPEFLSATEMYLASEGFSVFACAQSKQALQTIRRLKPDAVLLDYDMPEATGLEILNRLRGMSLTRSVPVMFLTASGDPDLMGRGFRSGLDDYLSKPFRGEELALRLNAVIERNNRAATAGRGHDPEILPQSVERLLILQTTDYAPFQRSGHAALAEQRGARRRLLHRLRDVLGAADIQTRARRDGIVLLFPGDTTQSPAGLKRALAAANRLPVMSQAADFLAPLSDTDATLIRFPWPRFRLLDIHLAVRGPRNISHLLKNLALELDRRDTAYQRIHL